MDEEVTIIDSKTRNEKIKNFLLKNAKLISFFIIALLLVIIGFYTYQIFQDQKESQFLTNIIAQLLSIMKTKG